MPYTPKDWADGPAGDTPIYAADLEHMETQYAEAVADASPSRSEAVFSTASLAAGARQTGTVALAASYTVLMVEVSTAARVRLYATVADRTADLTRPRGTDPDDSVDHGVMFDLALGSAGSRISTPPAPGVLNELPPGVPITIDNLDSVSRAITVTITFLRTE